MWAASACLNDGLSAYRTARLTSIKQSGDAASVEETSCKQARPPKKKTSETAEQQVSVACRSQDSCDKHAFQSTCFAFRCKQAALDLMGANSPSDDEDDLQCQHEEPPGNSTATNSSTIAHTMSLTAGLCCYPTTGSTIAASTPLDVATSGSSDAPSSSAALPPALHGVCGRS